MKLKLSDNLENMVNKGKNTRLDGDANFRMPNNRDLSSNYNNSEDKLIDDKRIDYVREYVMSHVSGVKLDNNDCLFAGAIASSFKRFVDLVERGANIVNAEVINADLISFEFQLPNLDKGKSR